MQKGSLVFGCHMIKKGVHSDCSWDDFNYALKVGVSALTHALAMSMANKVRVNAVSPGWIDTGDSELSSDYLYKRVYGSYETGYFKTVI